MILWIAVCAVIAGARFFVAIAEWAAQASLAAVARLGVTGEVRLSPRSEEPSAVCGGPDYRTHVAGREGENSELFRSCRTRPRRCTRIGSRSGRPRPMTSYRNRSDRSGPGPVGQRGGAAHRGPGVSRRTADPPQQHPPAGPGSDRDWMPDHPILLITGGHTTGSRCACRETGGSRGQLARACRGAVVFSLCRHRARVGPMLPVGMPRRWLICR